MPIAVVLEISETRDPWWLRMDAYRALAYALFEVASPAFAEELHNSSGPRPFTLAVLKQTEQVGARITALEPDAEQALLRGLNALSRGKPLRIGNTGLQATGCLLDAPPLAGSATYAELHNAPLRERASLSFLSPTAFSQGDAPDLPLPVPSHLLRSWAARWNRFAPETLRFDAEIVETVARLTALAAQSTESRMVPLGKAQQIGFTGSVALEARNAGRYRWESAEQQAFAALTAYSLYCGTGVKTTQGFGLTLPE